MRLRQLALVARDLDDCVGALRSVLGLGAPYADPGVATFGLRNAVFPIGDTFLEVISPDAPDTTAGRFLDRRGGDGGYMVIVQTEDRSDDVERVGAAGVRIVWEIEFPDISTIHLHPRDVGGAILSLDVADPPGSWRWAGPNWAARSQTHAVASVEAVDLQAHDPAALAERWSAVLGRPAADGADGVREIALDRGSIRFVPAQDERGEGIAAIALRAADRAGVLERARERGLECGDSQAVLCGTRIRLV